MRIQLVGILLSLLCGCPLTAQTDEWELIGEFPIDKEEVWTVDGIGNVVVTHRDQLTKYAPDGKKLFEQSQKSFGRLEKIEPFNTLKFVCFSEQQQTICFFDNSLTALDGCLDLADYDILNATLFATSAQSDKLWVFDQVNSTLRLLSLNGLNQDQTVKNLGGIIQADRITQLVEIDNKLFFVDPESGVFIFDLYGTLILHVEVTPVSWVQFRANKLIMLMGSMFYIQDIHTQQTSTMKLPETGIREFCFQGETFYFRSDQKIFKYKFLL